MNKYIFTSLLSLLVIVGFTSFINPHTVSAQPIEWEEFDLSSDDIYNSIAYGKGVYVVMGGSSTKTSTPMYSLDGKKWTPSDETISATFTSVVYGNNKFVAVGGSGDGALSGNPVVYISTDGKEWDSSEPLPPKTQSAARLTKVSYVYDSVYERNIYVAIGSDRALFGGSNKPYIVYSLDGENWTKFLPEGATGIPKGLAGGYNEEGDVIFLSSLPSSDYFSQSDILMSTDGGANWFYPDDTLTGLDDFEGFGMSYLNGKFFLTGIDTAAEEDNSFVIMASTNGLNWEKQFEGDLGYVPSDSLRTATYGAGEYLFVIEDGTFLYSLDGENWEFYAPVFEDEDRRIPRQVIYAEDSFVLLLNGFMESIVAFPKTSGSHDFSKSSSIFGTRFCSAGVTTFCRPQNGFVNNNPLISIYTELLGLYQQLLSAMQGENSL